MFPAILSSLRSIVITSGTAWAVTHGISSANFEALVGAAFALAAAAWGVYNGWKASQK
jgi:hypothetical protein